MTSTLTVIALITRMKSTSYTVNGDALYREKILNETHSFGFKQFVNARHEYNESFKEGDLVLFGGKFTLDEKKLVLVVEMACVMEPKIGPDGEYQEWDPMQIPSTKPFVNISTSAEGALTTYEDMNFVKTRSLIYSPFHPSARYVNFELGYSKDAKWLDAITDKWNDYANFFVGGFFEAVYSTNDKTYAQIEAKMIDYDVRFRHPNSQSQSPTTSPKKQSNTFALRRKETQKQDQSSKAAPVSTDSQSFSSPTLTNQSKKRQLSDLCNLDSEDDINNDINNDLGNDPDNDPDYSRNNPNNDPDNNSNNEHANNSGNDLSDNRLVYNRKEGGEKGEKSVRGRRGRKAGKK